jgi:hypothetical protein
MATELHSISSSKTAMYVEGVREMKSRVKVREMKCRVKVREMKSRVKVREERWR